MDELVTEPLENGRAAQGVLFAGKTRCGYCDRELEPHGTIDGQTVYQCPAFPGCASKMVAKWRELYG